MCPQFDSGGRHYPCNHRAISQTNGLDDLLESNIPATLNLSIITHSIGFSDNIATKISLIEERREKVQALLTSCSLCPRCCGKDRTRGEEGTCGLSSRPVVSSYHLHFGEERPISGFRGSGTIFFTSCNLRCQFCQNYSISHLREGVEVSLSALAEMMLHLQREGAHNINLVTPTHQAAAIFEALLIAFQRGLKIPIVYNCGGYESLDMLRLWDGIIDIYMPDLKFGDDHWAKRLASAPDYFYHATLALKEMHRQVGVLQLDENGVAIKGLLVRHLVLPGDLSATYRCLAFIAHDLSPETHLSLMSQYYPAYRSFDYPPLDRRLTPAEYAQALQWARELGLKNLLIQGFF